MKPEHCQVGQPCEYAPSPGHWFRGIIADEPWQLGSGHWVTKLVAMEPGYADFTGKRGDKATTVSAASLTSMRDVAGGSVNADELAAACERFRDEILHGIDQFDNWQTNAVLDVFDSVVGSHLPGGDSPPNPKCGKCGKYMIRWITVGGDKSSYGALTPDDPTEMCLTCAKEVGACPRD